MRWIERQWQQDTISSRLLLPLALLYSGLVALNRELYRRGWRRSQRAPVPVVVVGNITVGGTGKTPLVLWIVEHLSAHGWRPGIVTRGYGGAAKTWPQVVTHSSDPALVGDEPLLLARRSGRPVVADPDRARGAQRLVESGCNVIVSDDGLQHHRLQRDLEIAVVDGVRRLGNGRCLPAGPLREPAARLREVDAVVAHGPVRAGEWSMTLVPGTFRRVRNPEETAALETFRNQTVHAVAGIGFPPRFFALLRELGVGVIEHPFNDHHRFRPSDLSFADARAVIMTEKDAVKCQGFAGDAVWYLAVDARLDARFAEWLQQRLRVSRG